MYLIHKFLKLSTNLIKWQFCHIDEPQGHYTMQNKPVTKDKCFMTPHSKYLKFSKS